MLAALVVVVVAYLALAPTGRYLRARRLGRGRDPRAPAPDRRHRRRFGDAARRRARSSGSCSPRARSPPTRSASRRSESFTTFSQLDRDTLVLVLSGAYRDKLAPYTWWFPDRRPRAVQGLLRFRRGARRRRARSTPRASTSTSGRRRRSARSAGSTTRCCRRRCAPTRSTSRTPSSTS